MNTLAGIGKLRSRGCGKRGVKAFAKRGTLYIHLSGETSFGFDVDEKWNGGARYDYAGV